MRIRAAIPSLGVTVALIVVGLAAAVTAERAGLDRFGVAFAAILPLMSVAVWRLVDGLIAFGMLVLMTGTLEHWTGLDLRFVDEAGIALLILVALVAHRRRVVRLTPGVREIALAVLVAVALVSSVVNDVPGAVWIPGLGLLLKGVAFFYIVVSLRFGEEDLRRVGGVFLIVGTVAIAIGFAQFVVPEPVRGILHLPPVALQRGEIQVVNSVFTHPAIYGWLAATMSLFLFAHYVVFRRPWMVIASVVIGLGAVVSGRRTPLIGLVAGLAAGAVRLGGTEGAMRRIALPAATAGACVILLSFVLLGDFYAETLVRYGADPDAIGEILADQPDADVISSVQPRVALAVGSIAIARDELPFGAGLGRFGSHMSREEYSPLYTEFGLDKIYGLSQAFPIAVTDNFWPMILGETGVIGLLACGVFIASLTRSLWIAAGAMAAIAVHAFALGALLVFVEAIVRSMVSPVFVASPIAVLVFGTAALALSGVRSQAEAQAVVPGDPRSSAKDGSVTTRASTMPSAEATSARTESGTGSSTSTNIIASPRSLSRDSSSDEMFMPARARMVPTAPTMPGRS